MFALFASGWGLARCLQYGSAHVALKKSLLRPSVPRDEYSGREGTIFSAGGKSSASCQTQKWMWIMSKTIIASLSLVALSLSACVVDGTEEGLDLDSAEEIGEESDALTSTQLANSFWLPTGWANMTTEDGRYQKDAVNGGNGKACWSHEKGRFSIGQITGSYYWLFTGTGCKLASKYLSFANSLGKAGVNPCTEGVTGITCTQPKIGSLVPLYSYPMTWAGSGQMSSMWNQIIAAKQANPTVPVRVIINPCNGPDISPCTTSWGAKLSDYTTGITALKNAGVVVLGYVATNYTNRTAASVQADINLYNSSYPGVSGIFFDEMTNDSVQSHIDYYKGLNDYAKTKNGTYVTVGNPGADTQVAYVYTVDTLVIYENSGVPSLAALQGTSNWHSNWDRSNFAAMSYGVSTLNSSALVSARPYVGYSFQTDDVLPNPWDTVPSFFSSLLAGLN